MERYFLICGNRLVKGVTSHSEFHLASVAYEYINGSWVEINCNEINDRLMGFDPAEDDFYALGNSEIMDEIEVVEEVDLAKYMR